jgi:sirohydrochlorin cobaltochelatase
MSNACLLVSHGSHDPRPALAAAQLAEQVTQLSPHLWVKTAVLECSPLPLHQQIQDFAQAAIAQNCTHLYLLPLFLLPGVHVMEDIPAEVAIAQSRLGETLPLITLPYLGTNPHLYPLLKHSDPPSGSTGQISTGQGETGRVLMSHGSRRDGGNAPVAAIAAQMGAVSAYWSVAPSLQTQVANLVGQGCQDIVILPYFLFEGGITDAIAQTVAQLAQEHPTTQFTMAETLSANPNLATHIVNLFP